MSRSKLRSGTRGRVVGTLRGLLAAPPALVTVRQRALHIITLSVLTNDYLAHAVLHLHAQVPLLGQSSWHVRRATRAPGLPRVLADAE